MLAILNVIGGRGIVCSIICIYPFLNTINLTPEIRIHSKSTLILSNEKNKLCLHKGL